MKKIITLTLLVGFTIYHLHAQTVSSKLSGTNLGPSNFFDYTSNSCTSTINTRTCAFDGNLANTFASCNTSGGWVGLDLGEAKIITRIAYCPRTNSAHQMVLGVFEGANNPDFGDAIPLLIIKETPLQNTLNSQTIVCSKGFRYLRYMGPVDSRSAVAEIEFYGYAGVGDYSLLPQATNLPSVIVHTTNAQDILDRETYIKGIVSVISENGTARTSDSLEIKGRGNFSWNFPKKPYRMKLFKKVSLVGMPAIEKSWTLINNYGDKTLMRNLLANDLSKRFEMPYTPAGKPVDVFLNGEYKGTYQLCDQIEVATARVAVEKMATTTTTLPDLSGGYLIEMDAYANEEISWFTSDRNKVPVTIKYPKDDEIIPAQSAFIKSHFEKMETALFASNFTDPANGYQKYIDIQTFIRHFLVGELSGNTDTYWSTYMYKKKNDDKFYFGPVWDFDIAFENDYRTYPINNNPNWIYSSTGSSANGVRDIVNRIFADPTFVSQLKAVYANYRNRGLINETKLLEVVDNYASEIDNSQKLNFKRWNIMYTSVHMNPKVYGSYLEEVNNVKSYIKNRIIWIDNKLSYVPSAVVNPAETAIYYWGTPNTLHIGGLASRAKITIMDIAGKTIASKTTDAEFSCTLPKGIYLVRVSDELAGNKVLKCIVQ